MVSRVHAQGLTPITLIGILLLGLPILNSCQSVPPPDPEQELIAKGRDLFFNETFNGNGRTCGTCHREDNNFTIDPAFIAKLPDDDPLFVAEFNPVLKDLERPKLMREFGLILENQDGFDDLKNNFNMRGVPHVLAQRTSIDSFRGPRTGWAGDGAPDDGSGSPPLDGSLRAFAIGAVKQHFTKTLNRKEGDDFRLPTDDELDALAAFQLSLGRQQDLSLPLPLKGTVARRGQEIFLDNTLGKCNACHFNAGANGNPDIFGPIFKDPDPGNLNFNTGVEKLPDQPADLTGEKTPPDDGFGNPGDHTFNTPSLVEAADTGPFFHNNSVETIEGAVAFYNSDAFNDSPAGQANGGINLSATDIIQVAGFLRVINALENIRSATDYLEHAKQVDRMGSAELLRLAIADIEDGIQVLGLLHRNARPQLRIAKLYSRIAAAFRNEQIRSLLINVAISALKGARGKMVDDQTFQPTAEVAAAE